MRITYKVESLDTDADWAHLAHALGDGHPNVVCSTIRHLGVLGVKSYVLEDPYIDRDYSADYLPKRDTHHFKKNQNNNR